MKQLFKTTLLATAVAVTCGTAYAGTVAVTKQVHSLEGLTGVTDSQTSANVTYTLAASYREGDKITFELSNASLDVDSLPSVIQLPPVNDAVEANTIAGLTLGLLNSDSTSVTYRVTSLQLPNNGATPAVEWDNGSTVGLVVGGGTDKLTFDYSPTVLATTGSVTVTVTSQTSVGDVLDNAGTRTATIAEAKTQFGTAAVTTKLNGVINVSLARQTFVSGNTDAMSYTITNPTTTGWLNVATVDTTNVTLFGEAGKMDNVEAGDWTTGGTKAFTANAAKLAVTYTGMTTNDTFTYTSPVDEVLEAQDFTTDFTYAYTSAGDAKDTKTIATGLDSGEWTLNGAQVNIPYMPYSATASQIIYVSNEGSQAGDILVTAFDDKGNTYDLGKVGVANATSIARLAGPINQALGAKGFTGGKLSITITVNAPSDDITVYASYNAGSVRGFVNTDEYKGK